MWTGQRAQHMNNDWMVCEKDTLSQPTILSSTISILLRPNWELVIIVQLLDWTILLSSCNQTQRLAPSQLQHRNKASSHSVIMGLVNFREGTWIIILNIQERTSITCDGYCTARSKDSNAHDCRFRVHESPLLLETNTDWKPDSATTTCCIHKTK